jgi:hypothetical protein
LKSSQEFGEKLFGQSIQECGIEGQGSCFTILLLPA